MLHSLTVKDYMEANLVTFKPDQEILDAIKLMLEHGISGAPVVDHMGEIIGILSEKDCLKVALDAAYYGELRGTVKEYMSSGVVTVDAQTNILDVAKMFMGHHFKRYPVVDDNRLVGQISRRDVLRAIEHFAEQTSFA